MGDWFRQTSWNREIEEYFFQKLALARKDSRAQYLKIQAIELIATNDPTVLQAAEMLIQKLLVDYPENKIDRSLSLVSLGDIRRILGDLPSSLYFYREAIDFEEKFPNVITDAYLHFAEVVIKLERQDLYSFVQRLIFNRVNGSPFPVKKYKAYSFLSIIGFRIGDFAEAMKFSVLAEESAAANTSTLRYHSDLGLVIEREEWIDALIDYHKNKRNESTR